MNRIAVIDSLNYRLGLAVDGKNLTQAQVDRLMLIVKEHFADHWRDDDSPQAERTFGVMVAA